MKKLLTTLLCIGMMWVANGQQLTGCMGVNFGSSTDQVKAIIGAKPGVELYTNTPETISYLNGKWGSRNCVGSIFKFYQNQLHSIVILVEAPAKPQIMDLYNEIVNDLENKYGVSFIKSHNFKYPYEEGDGHEMTAIKGGYATIASYVTLADGNSMAVSITESLSVKVEYQHAELIQKAIDVQKENNNKDY